MLSQNDKYYQPKALSDSDWNTNLWVCGIADSQNQNTLSFTLNLHVIDGLL